MKPHIERASMEDLPAVWAIDKQHTGDESGRAVLLAASEARALFVAKRGFTVLGYATREPTFFGYPYIARLAVDAEHDQAAVAGALLDYLEKTNPADRLFASVPVVDTDRQALWTGLGFVPSGRVENVLAEDGGAMQIYVKWL